MGNHSKDKHNAPERGLEETKMRTIDDIKRGNREAGRYFFSRETMRFFNSKIESHLIYDRFFITSERYRKEEKKLFTIREVLDGYDIGRVGDFQQFSTKKKALDFLNQHIDTLEASA